MKTKTERLFRLFVVDLFRNTLGRPEPCFRAFTTEELVTDLENYFQERKGKQVNIREVWEGLQTKRNEL